MLRRGTNNPKPLRVEAIQKSALTNCHRGQPWMRACRDGFVCTAKIKIALVWSDVKVHHHQTATFSTPKFQ